MELTSTGRSLTIQSKSTWLPLFGHVLKYYLPARPISMRNRPLLNIYQTRIEPNSKRAVISL